MSRLQGKAKGRYGKARRLLSKHQTKIRLKLENGRGGWIRTNAWQDQNLLPYRLATPLYRMQQLLPRQFQLSDNWVVVLECAAL